MNDTVLFRPFSSPDLAFMKSRPGSLPERRVFRSSSPLNRLRFAAPSLTQTINVRFTSFITVARRRPAELPEPSPPRTEGTDAVRRLRLLSTSSEDVEDPRGLWVYIFLCPPAAPHRTSEGAARTQTAVSEVNRRAAAATTRASAVCRWRCGGRGFKSRAAVSHNALLPSPEG